MQIEIDIPIYRAKKKDSNEYIIGYLNELIIPDIEILSDTEQADIFRTAYFITNGNFIKDVGCSYNYCRKLVFDYKIPTCSEIDITTLSIHIPNKMVDSEGNKIFASLNDKGTGADIVFNDITGKEEVLIFDAQETIPYFSSFSDYKVTGKIKV